MSLHHYETFMKKLDAVLPTTFNNVPAEKSGNPNKFTLAHIVVDVIAKLSGRNDEWVMWELVKEIRGRKTGKDFNDAAEALTIGEEKFGQTFLDEVSARVDQSILNYLNPPVG